MKPKSRVRKVKIKGNREQKIAAVLRAISKLGKRFPGTKIRKLLNNNYSQGAISERIFVKSKNQKFFVFNTMEGANTNTARKIYEAGVAVGKKYTEKKKDPFDFMRKPKSNPASLPKPITLSADRGSGKSMRKSTSVAIDYVPPLHMTMTKRLNQIAAAIEYRLKRNMPIDNAWISEWNAWWITQNAKK